MIGGSKLGDAIMKVTIWRCSRNWDEVCIRSTMTLVCHYTWDDVGDYFGWRRGRQRVYSAVPLP